MKIWILAAAALPVLGAIGLVPIGGPAPQSPQRSRGGGVDLSAFSNARPATPLRLLFIHHSCGGQLLADQGDEQEAGGRCLYQSHPSGGGLRHKLEAQGYEVHEASYGSEIGEHTDAFDWVPKFRDKMDKVLTVDKNDRYLASGLRHQIVVFKSCYTESRFQAEGAAPGSPNGPEKTLWNYKAHMAQLLEQTKKHPDVLFVYLTPPPLSAVMPKERLFRFVANALRGRPHLWEQKASQAAIGRKYTQWVSAADGWLRDYPVGNVAAFDYFDVLTGHGASNLSQYATPDGDDHPTLAGNEKAADEFVPFLNQAVRRHAVHRAAAIAAP